MVGNDTQAQDIRKSGTRENWIASKWQSGGGRELLKAWLGWNALQNLVKNAAQNSQPCHYQNQSLLAQTDAHSC